MQADKRLEELIDALQERPDTVEDYMEQAMDRHQLRKGRRPHMFDMMRTFVSLVVSNAGDYKRD